MRDKKQISKLLGTVGDTRVVKEFITEAEANSLLDFFNNSPDKIQKNTGSVTLNIDEFLGLEIFKNVLDKVRSEIGQFEILSGLFFEVTHPHILHNDDTYEMRDDVYKGVLVPLYIEWWDTGHRTYPKFCVFDQMYFGGPAKFFKDEELFVPTYFNKIVTDYAEIYGLSDMATPKDELFGHLKHEKYLEGLTLNAIVDWIPKNAVIFDSLRIHCSSDFRSNNVKKKIGLSIFTRTDK
jgi:hypothetical protein